MDMRCHLRGREGDSVHSVSDKILEMLVGIDLFVRTSEVHSSDSRKYPSGDKGKRTLQGSINSVLFS